MDKKALIAIVICGIIMILYYPFIQPLFYSKEDIQVQETKEEITSEKEADIKSETQPESTSTAQITRVQTDIPLKEVVIENELLKTVWTNEGAALQSIELKQFKDGERKNVLELLKNKDTKYRPLAIEGVNQKTDFQKQHYNIVEQSSNKIVFATSLEDGINIIKKITLSPGKYNINMEVTLENTTDTDLPLSYNIIASSMITHEGEVSVDIASVMGLDVGNNKIKLIHTAPKELPSKNESVGIVWAGSTNKYFSTILKPASTDLVKLINTQAFDPQGNLINEKSELGDFMVTLETNKFSIPPHDTINHSYIYFTGPKKEEILAQYETMDALLSYGWLTSISKALLYFLNIVYKAVPNYGVSIIILTIIIKAMLFPLTRKSQLSMFRMQQLQPMISQLKEKYKHDKQRQGKEQVQLFKKYRVNPMSGCLPMLLQLPVFIALFRTLQLSFEMRQAPFMLWINDLSRPDTLLYLTFSIPFIGNALNILPLIMTGASFAQMKIMPKAPATDPQAKTQQKMMSFMPIMFAFILYHMPSGLTIYWTTSTILSIIESILIRKSTKKIKF